MKSSTVKWSPFEILAKLKETALLLANIEQGDLSKHFLVIMSNMS